MDSTGYPVRGSAICCEGIGQFEHLRAAIWLRTASACEPPLRAS